MLTRNNRKSIMQSCAIAVVLGALSLSLVPTFAKTARPEAATADAVQSNLASGRSASAEAAAATFIRAMAAHDVGTVWMFASEEDQDAFATEEAVFAAFADVFPALTEVEEVTFERSWQEGDTPFVSATLSDGSEEHRAMMGFWLDDAGDWKLVSCDVRPASDLVAGL